MSPKRHVQVLRAVPLSGLTCGDCAGTHAGRDEIPRRPTQCAWHPPRRRKGRVKADARREPGGHGGWEWTDAATA